MAIAESCMAGEIGAHIESGITGLSLFTETQSCVVLTCRAEDARRVAALAERAGVPCVKAGRVGGERLLFSAIDVAVSELREAYEGGLPRALEGVTANA